MAVFQTGTHLIKVEGVVRVEHDGAGACVHVERGARGLSLKLRRNKHPLQIRASRGSTGIILSVRGEPKATRILQSCEITQHPIRFRSVRTRPAFDAIKGHDSRDANVAALQKKLTRQIR